MEKIKEYIGENFEKVLVLVVLLSILIINYVIINKLAFLNFYYLPVLLAGFFLGRRMAVLLSLFCVLLVSLFALTIPQFFKFLAVSNSYQDIAVSLIFWGSFLILTGYVVGTLFKEKELKIQDLKKAYIGVLEILSKYLGSTDRYTKGHSIRVTKMATEIAIAMEFTRDEVENIKAAALLHDIGKVDISMELIRKVAHLSTEEKEILDTHSEKGAKILQSVGDVLKQAVPIVLSHHIPYKDIYGSKYSSLSNDVKMGASIVSVADAYDAIITDRPYRAGKHPSQALKEIENGSGEQFHPDVVKALARVMTSVSEHEQFSEVSD